jgi:hypothetical protein
MDLAKAKKMANGIIGYRYYDHKGALSTLPKIISLIFPFR